MLGKDTPRSAKYRYRTELCRRLVLHRLLREEAVRLGVDPGDRELERRIALEHRAVPDWPEHLERQGESVASQRAVLMAALRISAILEARGALDPTPEELDEEYRALVSREDARDPRVLLSQILIPFRLPRGPTGGPLDIPTEAARAAKSEAADVARQVWRLATEPGADFGTLAAEHDARLAQREGRYGVWTEASATRAFGPAVSRSLFEGEPGQVFEPVEGPSGFTIFKLRGRWSPGPPPVDAIGRDLIDTLRARKLAEGARQLRKELLDRYDILEVEPIEESGPTPRRGLGSREVAGRDRPRL